MQVYRGMDIGTAKPSPAERAEVPHHLIDVADPAEEFTVTRYTQSAEEVLAAIEARGHRALLVGGTGLYLRSVVDELRPPGRWPEIRSELEDERDTFALYRRLDAIDPAAAARTTPTNRRRIVRALEVGIGSGRPFSSFGPGLDAYRPNPRFLMAGLWMPRAVVARRIGQRFTAMVAAGLVGEVRALARRPEGLSRTARQALGYKELLAHVEDGAPLEACVDEAVRRSRAFARRQRMWFRRDPRIRWWATAENPVAVIPALLGEWSKCV
jgi:tRNA dimethylallyltransferase